MQKIKVGIVGYGNVGRGVEKAVNSAPDMELAAFFTRRAPDMLETASKSVPVVSVSDVKSYQDKIDVMILCGGSATDLAEQGPHFASMFNIVDSFDTHAKIPEYLKAVDAAAKSTAAVISSGWDPGLFSLMRLISNCALPDGDDYTFWGYGVSQGHSDAIRRIDGVARAVQYTVPVDAAVSAVKSGTRPQLTTREKHTRECYVVLKDGADAAKIEKEIKEMPNYFSDYDTTVNFISDKEFSEKHTKMPHGGTVFRSGNTGENKQVMEFSLTLGSNPEFTGSVLTAYARAAYRLAKENSFGAKTVFDIPATYLSDKDRLELISNLL